MMHVRGVETTNVFLRTPLDRTPSNTRTRSEQCRVPEHFEDLPSVVHRPVIPVIPFCLEFGRIRETVETVPEVANLLETRENTGYHA